MKTYFGCDPDTKWGSKQQDRAMRIDKTKRVIKQLLQLPFVITGYFLYYLVKYTLGLPYLFMLWLFRDSDYQEVAEFVGLAMTLILSCIVVAILISIPVIAEHQHQLGR